MLCTVSRGLGTIEPLIGLTALNVSICPGAKIFSFLIMSVGVSLSVKQLFPIASGLTDAWSFADTIFGLFFVIITYLMVVVIVLPDFMTDRAPFQLKKLLLFYNAFQVAFSVYLVAIVS